MSLELTQLILRTSPLIGAGILRVIVVTMIVIRKIRIQALGAASTNQKYSQSYLLAALQKSLACLQ